MRSSSAASSSTCSTTPSSSTRSTAPAPSGYPGATARSAASIVSRSIISIADGMTPAATIPETAAPAASIVWKPASSVRTACGARTSRSVMRVAIPSVPSEPTIDAEEVRPVGVERLAAELDDLAVRQDEREPGDVVRGEPVLQAVRAAGVLGDVAADRAHLLARGVGRVEEAVRGDGARHVEVRDARLDDDRAGSRGRSRGSGSSVRARRRRRRPPGSRRPRARCRRRARRTGRARDGTRAARPGRPRSNPGGRRAREPRGARSARRTRRRGAAPAR